MKIRVKIIEPICAFSAIKKGDWIDLRSSKEIILKAPMITKNKEITYNIDSETTYYIHVVDEAGNIISEKVK